MVASPLCAELWHPLGRLREIMRENAFCHLPVNTTPGESACWALLSELALEGYLRQVAPAERPERLREPLGEAIEAGLQLCQPIICTTGDPVAGVIEDWDGCPILVLHGDHDELAGILTSSDLLRRHRSRAERFQLQGQLANRIR